MKRHVRRRLPRVKLTRLLRRQRSLLPRRPLLLRPLPLIRRKPSKKPLPIARPRSKLRRQPLPKKLLLLRLRLHQLPLLLLLKPPNPLVLLV